MDVGEPITAVPAGKPESWTEKFIVAAPVIAPEASVERSA